MPRHAIKLAIIILFSSVAAHAAISCTGGAAAAVAGGGTSGALNTTGATLLVAGTIDFGVPSIIKDSKTNYWNFLSTWGGSGAANPKATIGWVLGSTAFPLNAGSSHTITNLNSAAGQFPDSIFAFCTGTSTTALPTVNLGNAAASGSTTWTAPSFSANTGDVMFMVVGTNGAAFTVSTVPTCLGVTFTTLGTQNPGGGNEGAAFFFGVAASSGTCSTTAVFSANTDWIGAVAVFPNPATATVPTTFGTSINLALGAQVGISGGYAESCTPADPVNGAKLTNMGQIAFANNGLMVWDDVQNDAVRVYNPTSFNIFAFGKTINAGCTALIAGQATQTVGFNYSTVPILGTSAIIAHPAGLAINPVTNDVYVADQQNHRIFEVRAADGMLFTVAGSGVSTDGTCNNGAFGGDGNAPTAATLSCPQGVWYQSGVNPYLVIADGLSRRLRIVNLAGTTQSLFGQSIASNTIKTVVGTGAGGCGISGAGTSAAMGEPVSVSVFNGILYWADGVGSTCPYFLQANSSGTVSVFAGTGSQGYLAAGTTSAACTSFPFYQPFDVKFDTNGVAYLTDQLGSTIAMAKSGTCQYLAGNPIFYGNRGGYGPVGGPARFTAMEGAFNSGAFGPIGATPDNLGNLWINDSGFNRILKMNVPCFGTCVQ